MSQNIVRLLMTVAIVATGTAIALGLKYEFALSGTTMLYLLAIMIAAARYGPYYGFLAALLSVSLFDFVEEQPLFTFALGTRQDLLNAIVFVAAALITGVYADKFRQQQAATRLLLEATQSLPEPNVRRVTSTLLASAREAGTPGVGIVKETGRIVIGVSIVLCAGLLLYLMRLYFAIPGASGVFVAAVLAAALFVGARAALVSAVVAVITFNFLFEAPHLSLSLGTAEDFANLAVFTGIAWLVGDGMDNIRNERAINKTLIEASTALSTLASEAKLRSLLRETISSLSGSNSVWVLDEQGKLVDAGQVGPWPPQLHAEELVRQSEAQRALSVWRVAPLRASTQNFGAVIWFSPVATGPIVLASERAINAVIDVASAAISRTRSDNERAAMENLAQTERLRAAMLSSLSHDFRSPLAGILGSATSLLELGERFDQARRTDLLSNIRDQAMRLNRYVENLLSLTKLEAGVVTVEAREEDIEPLIYDAWEALGDAGGARRILDARIPDGAKALVDPVLLHQALANVFENAIKFSTEGSTVRVRSKREGARQLVEIVDEGPGVDPADLERIFERFFRGKGPSAPGTGLGLHIAKSVVEAMHGIIEARPRDDGQSGLVVSIALPAAQNL